MPTLMQGGAVAIEEREDRWQRRLFSFSWCLLCGFQIVSVTFSSCLACCFSWLLVNPHGILVFFAVRAFDGNYLFTFAAAAPSSPTHSPRPVVLLASLVM
ncbi:hypothetical protein C8J56DRAFT_395981 [Mycena floridula]|nr:hypothetical protein C8J56DRAFT_395981 [Mycena floridula]